MVVCVISGHAKEDQWQTVSVWKAWRLDTDEWIHCAAQDEEDKRYSTPDSLPITATSGEEEERQLPPYPEDWGVSRGIFTVF